MNGLLPIIRRARRPLYPPDDAAPAVPPSVVELPPSAPPVESVVSEPAVAPPVAPVKPKAKKGKRGDNASA
jgi:hypothetical protein